MNKEHEEIYKELLMICKENEGATDSDMVEYNNKAVPTTKTGQCLNTCILEHIGVVSVALIYFQLTAIFF